MIGDYLSSLTKMNLADVGKKNELENAKDLATIQTRYKILVMTENLVR